VKKKLLKILILTTLTAFLGGIFSLPKGKAQPVPPSSPDWDNRNIEIVDHNFQEKDSGLADVVRTAISQANFTVEYKSKQSISYWDFLDPEEHREHFVMDDRQYIEYVKGLAKRSYSIFPLPGVTPFFLIIDNDSNKTKGIFKKITINDCTSQEGRKVTCPWTYYKAYSSWAKSATGYTSSFIYRDGKLFLPEYKLEASSADQERLSYKYIQSVNKTQYPISGPGGTVSCAKVGSELSAEEYAKCFFPEGGRFPVSIKDNGDKPPTIQMSGATFDQSKYPGASRPSITFTLKYALRSQFSIEQTGGNDNYFYFVATNPSYPNLAIRLKNCQEENYFVTTNKKDSLSDDGEIGRSATGIGEPIAVIDQDSIMKNLINKVYNNGPYANGNCPYNFINWEDNGQLAKWGVERIDRNEPEQGGGTGAPEESDCEKAAKCSSLGSSWNIFSAGFYKRMFCAIGCMIYDAIGQFVKWSIERLNSVSGVTFNIFGIEKAYATPLSEQLQKDQVVTGWKFSLAITDIIVVFALLLIAFANILKLNIDIYAVKKALPGLLIGVILANLSLLISRVIVDFASLLTQYFLDKASSSMGGASIGTGLASLMGLSPEATGGTFVGVITIFVISAVLGTPIVGCLLIIGALLLLAFPGLLILALAFLMYARLYVIWILVILSPLAFVVLGFPPAQQYFKTWWSWFLKWVFLAPIAYFFIALGALLGSITWRSSDNTLSYIGRWILGVIVLTLALYVPQKLGGAIMAGWSALGQKMAGINKGGYLRKPAEEFGQRKWKGFKEKLAASKLGQATIGRMRAGRAIEEAAIKKRETTALHGGLARVWKAVRNKEAIIANLKEKRKRGETLTKAEQEMLDKGLSLEENRVKVMIDKMAMEEMPGWMDVPAETLAEQLNAPYKNTGKTLLENYMAGTIDPADLPDVLGRLAALRSKRRSYFAGEREAATRFFERTAAAYAGDSNRMIEGLRLSEWSPEKLQEVRTYRSDPKRLDLYMEEAEEMARDLVNNPPPEPDRIHGLMDRLGYIRNARKEIAVRTSRKERIDDELRSRGEIPDELRRQISNIHPHFEALLESGDLEEVERKLKYVLDFRQVYEKQPEARRTTEEFLPEVKKETYQRILIEENLQPVTQAIQAYPDILPEITTNVNARAQLINQIRPHIEVATTAMASAQRIDVKRPEIQERLREISDRITRRLLEEHISPRIPAGISEINEWLRSTKTDGGIPIIKEIVNTEIANLQRLGTPQARPSREGIGQQ